MTAASQNIRMVERIMTQDIADYLAQQTPAVIPYALERRVKRLSIKDIYLLGKYDLGKIGICGSIAVLRNGKYIDILVMPDTVESFINILENAD